MKMKNIVMYRRHLLEAIQKWDGKAPQTLVIGDAVQPMLNLQSPKRQN